MSPTQEKAPGRTSNAAPGRNEGSEPQDATAGHNGKPVSAPAIPRHLSDGDAAMVSLGAPRKPSIAELLAHTTRPLHKGTTAATEPHHAPPALDWYANAEGKAPTNTCTLPDLIDGIKSEEFRERVERIRALVERGQKDQANELKRQLPAVSISGCIEGRRKAAAAEGRFTHSGFLQIDLDAKDHPGMSLDDMRNKLFADTHIQAIFVSPSGNGVKGIARIPAVTTTHKAAFLAAEKHFAALGLKIDQSCKDPVRLCFVSHDMHAWLRPVPASELQPLPEDLAGELSPRPVTGSNSAKVAGESHDEEAAISNHVFSATGGITIRGDQSREITVADVRAMLSVIPPRPAYYEWIKIASAVWNTVGESDGTTLLAGWSPEEEPGEYDRKFKNKLGDINAGTLVMVAKANGYQVPIRVRAASLDVSQQQAELIEEALSTGKFLHRLSDDHRGFAQAYADVRFQARCFCHDEGKWRIYQSGVWQRDDTNDTLEDLQSVVTSLFMEAVNDEAIRIQKLKLDKDQMKAALERLRALRKSAKALFNLVVAKRSLENASLLPDFAALREKFDRSPHLLAIENGTIDFEKCIVRQHSPADMLTKRAPLFFDASAGCPKFDRFMTEVTCGDSELVDYLFEILAVAHTGLTDYDGVPFFFGGGSNGKSTFLRIVEMLLGPQLAAKLSNGVLLGARESSSDDYKLAGLEGIRLAVVNELPDNRTLRTDLLKQIVGGDAITARNPYERQRTFEPSHKIWLAGNHKPAVKDAGSGTWRRIQLVPWNASFDGSGPTREERARAFFTERAGILNRVMAAWRRVKETGGVTVPGQVREASAQYQSNEDQVKRFTDEALQKTHGINIPLAEIRRAYDVWCASESEQPVAASNRKLSEELKRLHFETKAGSGNKTMVQNVAINPPPKPTDES